MWIFGPPPPGGPQKKSRLNVRFFWHRLYFTCPATWGYNVQNHGMLGAAWRGRGTVGSSDKPGRWMAELGQLMTFNTERHFMGLSVSIGVMLQSLNKSSHFHWVRTSKFIMESNKINIQNSEKGYIGATRDSEQQIFGPVAHFIFIINLIIRPI